MWVTAKPGGRRPPVNDAPSGVESEKPHWIERRSSQGPAASTRRRHSPGAGPTDRDGTVLRFYHVTMPTDGFTGVVFGEGGIETGHYASPRLVASR